MITGAPDQPSVTLVGKSIAKPISGVIMRPATTGLMDSGKIPYNFGRGLGW